MWWCNINDEGADTQETLFLFLKTIASEMIGNALKDILPRK